MKKNMRRILIPVVAMILILSMQISVLAASITKQKAQSIALANAGLKAVNVKLSKVKAGICKYKVEDREGVYTLGFKSGNCRYEVELLAATYRPMGKPLTWILTIARNLSYNRIRDAVKADDISEHTELYGATGVEHVEDRLLLDSLLDMLSEEDSQIVLLHAVAGWKHREIAEWMDLPLSTVLSKYSRAINKMRNEMERKGDASDDRTRNT